MKKVPAFMLSIVCTSLSYAQDFAADLSTFQRAQVVSEKAFSASGEVVLPHLSLPAKLHFDQYKKAFLIDINIDGTDHSTVYYDWGTSPGKGYIQSSVSCTYFSLGNTKAPDVLSLFRQSRQNKKTKKQGVYWRSKRENDKKNTLEFQFKDTALLFKVEKIKSLRQNVFNPVDQENCIEIKSAQQKNITKLKKYSANSAPLPGKSLKKDFSVSNLLYGFYGFYSSVNYAGRPFYQSALEHENAVSRCKEDGDSVCKTEWESGGLFGRYGYYCGDGWTNNSYQPMSSLDYCCEMHDHHAWGKSHLKNLCGFYACIACSDKGSLQTFKDEYDAADIIEKFTKTGAFLTGCSYDGWASGFSCSN